MIKEKIGTSSSSDEFSRALDVYAPRFGIELETAVRALLRSYYEHVQRWNDRLHLVAPCSAEEFAVRHVLESLVAVPFLPANARVIDIGSGAGLPVIPCLLRRPDMDSVLYEASPKKAVFLREALYELAVHPRARVVAERFEKTNAPEANVVMCRALDRFGEMLRTLIDWSPARSRLLLYGGPALGQALREVPLAHAPLLIPESEQRYLFITEATHRSSE